MSRAPVAAARVPAPTLERSRAKPARAKPAQARPARRPPVPHAARRSLETMSILAPGHSEMAGGGDVIRVELPYQVALEQTFDQPLDGVVVLSGEAVTEWLTDQQADAAAIGDTILLASPAESIDTIAHEIVHALQARAAGGASVSPVAPAAAAPDVLDAQHPAEVEAGARGSDPSPAPVAEAVPAGAVALRRTIPVTPSPGEQTPEKEFERGLDESAAPEPPAASPEAKSAEKTTPAGGKTPEEEAAERETGEEAPEETPAPTFELPAMPETELSAEEKAARAAEAEAASAAIAEADDAEGVVTAYAEAPPTVKAAAQSTIGGRIGEVVASDQQEFQDGLPEFHATLSGGELAAPEAAAGAAAEAEPAAAPEPAPVVLEAEAPAPAPEPDLPPVPAPEPYTANDDVGSLLSRLYGGDSAAAIAQSLNAVQTTDPSIETTAGERPPIPLEGETDPARLDEQQQAGAEHAQMEREAASQAVLDGRGPEQAQLRAVDEVSPTAELPPLEVAPFAGAPEAEALGQMAMPEEVLAQFDQDAGAEMQANLDEARTQVGQAETDRDTQREAAVSTAETERDRLTAEADAAQRDQVLAARETIQTEQQTAIDGQQAAVTQLEADAEAARSEQQTAIETRVGEDEGKITQEYDKAEVDAQAEVAKGETQAESERVKAEQEAEEESWWDAAVSFVSDLFEALTSLINDIFDAVRSAVKGILDAVRDFAKGLIDLAAGFIKGAIALYASALKGLIDITVGQVFPELAADLNAGIDSAVETLNSAVDAVADTLKAGVDMAVDALNAAINLVINNFQAMVNGALAIMEAAITGDWAKLAMKLLDAVLHLLGIDPTAFHAFIAQAIETVDIILNDPLGFLGNLLNAVVLGFEKFAGNFLTHLQAGVIAWLTGALGGIQIPTVFDLMGVLDLARQILGLTWEWVREKAVRLVGEENVARLEFILSYVTTLVEGGFPALWQRITDDLGGLVSSVISAISEFLVEKVIIAGITWLASLFSPVGALVKLVFTIWNLYTFVRDQLARVIQIAETIVQGLANIAHGIIESAALKVESALATLLPVAIDLVAKLLGLTGVTAKVRQIIEDVRTWIDNAINKLLDKVLAAFTGKGETVPDAAVDEAAADATIGESVTVDVEDGPDHTLTIDASGPDATAMLHSSGRPVEGWITDFERAVAELPETTPEEEEQKAAAPGVIGRAREALTAVDRAANADPRTDEAVVAAQRTLGLRLFDVFQLFGGEEADLLPNIFAREIQAAHPEVREALNKAVAADPQAFQALTWQDAKDRIVERKLAPFFKPLLSDSTVSHEMHLAVDDFLAGRGLQFVNTTERDVYYSHWLVPKFHEAKEPDIAAALPAVRRILFDGGSLADCNELDAAAEKAYNLQDQADDTADEDLREVKDIIEFLEAVARDEPTYLRIDLRTSWPGRLWEDQPKNRYWIQARFRAAAEVGSHEWILTHLIDKVIERHRESVTAQALPAGASWFHLQNKLRTPTALVILPLTSARTAPYRRDPKPPHDRQEGSAGRILQGHPGAVYAPMGPGDYRNDVVQQTEGSPGWHNQLESIFTSNPGTSRGTMATIVNGIDKFWQENLWFGEEDDLGFDEYYSKAKKVADGEDMVTFESLRDRAREANGKITTNFDDARGVVGL